MEWQNIESQKVESMLRSIKWDQEDNQHMIIITTHHDNEIINFCAPNSKGRYIRKVILEIDGEFNYKSIEKD